MGHRDDQQRVAVRCRLGGDVGADHPAGAAAVVDENLLAEFVAELVATMRPTTSLLPPGGNGMISRIERDG